MHIAPRTLALVGTGLILFSVILAYDDTLKRYSRLTWQEEIFSELVRAGVINTNALTSSYQRWNPGERSEAEEFHRLVDNGKYPSDSPILAWIPAVAGVGFLFHCLPARNRIRPPAIPGK
jgi:hypothetical protein